MKHTNTFRVECCGNRRAVVNDVIVCIHCDMAPVIPSWPSAKMPDGKVKIWTPNPVNPT